MLTLVFYVVGVLYCASKLINWIVKKVRHEKKSYDDWCEDSRKYSSERDSFIDKFRKRFDESSDEEQLELLRWLKGKKKGGEDE